MNESTIFIIDNDPGVCRAMHGVGQLLGKPVAAYTSAIEFLDSYDHLRPGCLVVEIRMHGMSGLELQRELIKREITLPVHHDQQPLGCASRR